MAKGFGLVEQQAQATQEAREQFAQQRKPLLIVNARNPGPYWIRFLEQGQDVNSYPVHEYKVPAPNVPGGFSYRRFTCLSEVNQECPGCQAGMKRKVRGVYNLIQRQRPILRKDKDGKVMYVNNEPIVDGHEDAVVIANVGGPTAEMLRKKDGNYHGLMSRDFTVAYSGDTFQSWTLDPADVDGGPQPMSQADMALAAQKHDLDEYMKPPSQQEAARIVAQYGGNSGVQTTPPQGQQPPAGNQFLAGVNQEAIQGQGGVFGAAAAAQQPPVQPQQPAAPAQAPVPAQQQS